jgi:serine/threonine protein kinase
VDGSPYLVREYIPGGTLKDKTGRPVPLETTLSWITPIADALAYAHEFGIIHRDIKPSNILFDQKGRPILTDFGVAKALETDEATLTGTGLGVGTPEYMAPEQWQGKTCPATDQYALGVVLYELLTGQKPYTADTPAALVILQATEPLPQPSQIVNHIPENIEKVLYKTLARNPLDRYESMSALKQTLDNLIVGTDERPSENEKVTANITPDDNSSNLFSARPSLSGLEIKHADGKPYQMEFQDELESEGDTLDMLDSTPGDEMRLPDDVNNETLPEEKSYPSDTAPKNSTLSGSGKSLKMGIPLVIEIFIGLCVIGAIILAIVSFVQQNKAEEEALIAARQTSAAEINATGTAEAKVTATAEAQATATAKAVINILATASSGFNELSLGLNGINDACEITNEVDQISQKEIFMEDPIYIASKFSDALSNESVDIIVRDPDGDIAYERMDWELSNEENNCFWWPIYLDPHAEPGAYVTEVSIMDIVILRHEFTVTFYDISSIERPARAPFGNFTFGRDYVDTETCEVGYQAEVFQLEEINNDPWFYFSTPYQMEDIGRSFYYGVYDADWNLIYDDERTTEDVYDLCFWQGFSMEDEPAGEYFLIIELDNGEEISFYFEIQ